MNITNNHITLNCPNLPVLSPSSKGEIPFGVFLDSPVDERNMLEPEIATMRSQDMYLPNFSIREFEANFKHEVVFKNLDAEGVDLLGSCLFLEANMRSYLMGDSTDVSFGQSAGIASSHRSHNFKYDPHNEYVHALAADSRIHYMHVSYDPGHFSRLLPENESWADWLKNKISKKERIIGDKSRPLSLAQLRAMQTILDCPMSGKLGEMMLETAITQVILFQLYYFFNGQEGSGPLQSNSKHCEMAFELKEYLNQNYLEDHSITSLSKQFGVNTNQLMASFKRQFGKSIFEYISDLRMEYATHLLQDKQQRVAEVARTLGYKNPNHFSTAFKRVFGVVPTDLRYQQAELSAGW